MASSPAPAVETAAVAPSGPQISQRMTVGKASVVLALMIALSRLFGFGRMILVSQLYGINARTDAYFAAFNIPETITIIIAGGALATGFVPVFTEYLSQGKVEAAQRTFRAMFTLLGLAFGVISLILFALTYSPWGALLAPAKVAPEVIGLYLRLLRILLVAQFFFVIGGLFSGVLNALRLFWYPALQPVMFNLGIIVFGIALPRFFGMGIESQAWGALVGALVGSLMIQMPAILRNGLSLRPLLDFHDPGVRRVMKSLLPIVLGLASGQIISLNLPRFFAQSLPVGNLSALDNANRLMQVPLDLLASGAAIALFPTLSLLAAEGKRDELRWQLTATFRRVLLLTLCASALLMALRFPVIHLLLEHGKFSKDNTKATSAVLWYYGLCIVGLGAQQLLARGFYALQDTRTPILIGMAAMALFGTLAWGVIHFAPISSAFGGAPALALSAAITVSLMGFAMWRGLSARLGGWDNGATFGAFWRGLLAAIAAYQVAHWLAHFGIQFITLRGMDGALTPSPVKLVARAAVVMAGGAFGAATFLIAAAFLKIEDLEGFTRRLPGQKSKPKFFEPIKFPPPGAEL